MISFKTKQMMIHQISRPKKTVQLRWSKTRCSKWLTNLIRCRRIKPSGVYCCPILWISKQVHRNKKKNLWINKNLSMFCSDKSTRRRTNLDICKKNSRCFMEANIWNRLKEFTKLLANCPNSTWFLLLLTEWRLDVHHSGSKKSWNKTEARKENSGWL